MGHPSSTSDPDWEMITPGVDQRMGLLKFL
jgi:hypothetical protein